LRYGVSVGLNNKRAFARLRWPIDLPVDGRRDPPIHVAAIFAARAPPISDHRRLGASPATARRPCCYSRPHPPCAQLQSLLRLQLQEVALLLANFARLRRFPRGEGSSVTFVW
uniref:Uncharacterized protein n=1 Tax=Oryza nivara TaxID=4536 RepID=A0A0E0J2Y0_ORYNI